MREITGNFAALANAQEGSEITLPLPDGRSEVTVVTHAAVDGDGFMQIHGVSRMDGLSAPTVITVGTEGVFGSVITQGREYQIVTDRQGKTRILDPRAAGWVPPRGQDHLAPGEENHAGHDDDHDHSVGRADPNVAAIRALSSTTGTTSATTTATTSSTQPVPLPAGTVDTTITLLMSYSPSYVNQWGSEALARTRLSNLVQIANAAYANSGTGIRFKIVGWSLVQQADTTPQTVLPALRGGTGSFSAMPALKQSLRAAISVFFAPFNSTTGATSTCGLAYIPGANAAGLSAFKSQAAGAMYAALNDGQYSGYYCESLSLAHELGHNLGNVHDQANSSFAGVFSYSYGKGVAGSFGTVMSYISPRVALFSSPQLKCGATQVPCGSSTENVVATMLQTKGTVAALGDAARVSVGTTGSTVVAGWLMNANGTPYTGAATVLPAQTGVSCTTGRTGLYVCNVPDAHASISVTVTVTGKTVTPALGSFPVKRTANTPVNGTRFYIH